MSELCYEDLVHRLLQAVPELRDRYEAERAWWGDGQPGPHNIYAAVLAPYIRELVEASSAESDDRAREIFGFLDELAGSTDPHVREVAVVSVLDHLLADVAVLGRARLLMGQHLRDAIPVDRSTGIPRAL